MLGSLMVGILALGAGGPEQEGAAITTYQNPLQVQLGDPWVLFDEGVYYLYGTHDRDPQAGFPVYTARDLVHWEWAGFAFRKTPQTWSQCNFWGPEVHKRGNKYYMYYCASPGPSPGPPFNMHLCTAESGSPLGPFHERAAPWYQPEDGDEAIDQSLLVDAEGNGWLYWTRVTMGYNQIEVTPLSPDLLRLAGSPSLCIRPTQPWELHAIHNHRVSEGAYVFRRDPYYYLTYTGNAFADPNYAIGYATSTAPTGPWTKSEHNPILARTDRVSGPGNGMIVPSPDGSELFMVYHTHQSVREVGLRQVAVDRVRFEPTAEGPARLKVCGPTHTPQPLPSGAPTRRYGRSEPLSSGVLDRGVWRVVNENPSAWQSGRSGVAVTTEDGDMWQNRGDFRNLFLQYLPPAATRISVAVSFDPQADHEQACLVLWQDHDNYVRLSQGWSGGPKLVAAVERDGVFTESAVENPLGRDVVLRITRDGGRYSCTASADQVTWISVGPPVEIDLASRQAGFGALAPGSRRPACAVFRDWRIE